MDVFSASVTHTHTHREAACFAAFYSVVWSRGDTSSFFLLSFSYQASNQLWEIRSAANMY